jgi:hypothetical protein
MATRCKFVCNFKSQQPQGDSAVSYLQFSPVYSGSEENKQFFAATPGGSLQFYTVNANAAAGFEQGKEYYIDIFAADGAQ